MDNQREIQRLRQIQQWSDSIAEYNQLNEQIQQLLLEDDNRRGTQEDQQG